MRKVRLGVIGCGFAARDLYGPAFRFIKNGELGAVMDVNEAQAKSLQEQYGVPRCYTKLDDIVRDHELEAVMVLTPPHRHREAVVAAAVAGKHVYCEKPMAATIEDADAMIGACRDNGVKLMIAFMKRFNKSFELVKSVLDEGRLGQVFEIRARWDNARTWGPLSGNYRLSLESGGGFLQEDGSHPLDICRWWLGDVAEVSGHVLIAAPEYRATDDVACVVLNHRNGALSTLHITMLAHTTGEESYEVFGTHGTLVMRWLFHSTSTPEPAIVHLYENSKTVTDLTLSGSWDPLRKVQDDWQYLRELEHFCDCVLNDTDPRCTGEDGRAIVEIVNAAYLSSWKGSRLRLPLQQSPDTVQFFEELHASSPWAIQGKTWTSRY